MTAQCALCGHRFEPATAGAGACSRCPLASGCRVSCCPRCGYGTPDTRDSVLVRAFERLFGKGVPA